MADLLGKTIGQYQLIEFIARGDTSLVYKGFQPEMNRYVAVKILSPSLNRNQAAVDAFLREAELMSQLEHESILAVYDHGVQDGVAYIASRFVEGGALSQRLSFYNSPHAILEIMEQIAGVLDYLHDRGIVYGNLRSSNILIDSQDRPLFTGLGMAERARGVAATRSVYMSPEQALGGAIDGRTDVYAMGVLLYEMVVGEAPPVGSLPSPRLKRPDLSTDVEKVILKAMAQYPEQRFQTCVEFYRALESALKPEPLPVAQPEPVPVKGEPDTLVFPAPEPTERQDYSWTLFALGGLAVIVIICGVAAFLIFFREQEDATAGLPGSAMVTAIADVNVRTGPAPQYNVIGVLTQGESAQATGRSPDGQWWQIVYPAGTTGLGWVSATFVTAQSAENLPIVEPPPPPTGEILPSPTLPPEPPTEAPPTATFPPEPPTAVPPTATFPPEPPTALPPTATFPPDIPTATFLPELPTATFPPEFPTATFPPGVVPSVAPPIATTDPGDGAGGICGLAGLPLGLLLLGGVFLPKKLRRRKVKVKARDNQESGQPAQHPKG